MTTVLPKAERGLELQATRVSVEPPNELAVPSSGDLPFSRRPYGPGDLIDGKYELESLLGKGGMGEVWTARNATLDVRRAVKLIRSDADSAESTDRLLHEAQAAARLTEAAIVRVFDFGKTLFGDPYIVMEMLEGEDLMSVIRRRERLSPTKAVRVLLPVIRALCAAHAHGIVHRDLKPENIFLSKLPDGRVQPKLLDFGIAKLKNARSLRLTSAGAVMGSPLYMAPEQARGEEVDERADIWALSVVLYESITGNPPFLGEDRAEVMRAAADASPARLSQHGVEDDSLWPIITRGLAKRREERWSSMEELGRVLARWLLGAGIIDDITGASLEAGWFRDSRQSLLASSSPPLRALRQAALPRLVPARPRDLRALALETLFTIGSRAKRVLGALQASRSPRWTVGVAVSFLIALGLVIAITSEPNGNAATGPTLRQDELLPASTAPTPIEGHLLPPADLRRAAELATPHAGGKQPRPRPSHPKLPRALAGRAASPYAHGASQAAGK